MLQPINRGAMYAFWLGHMPFAQESYICQLEGKRHLLQADAQGYPLTLSNCYLAEPETLLKPGARRKESQGRGQPTTSGLGGRLL